MMKRGEGARQGKTKEEELSDEHHKDEGDPEVFKARVICCFC
jgi:hypothetical protein